MAAEQRKLLEQLMGDQLMGPGASRAPQLSITDSRACRSFLVGTCPHDLFTNTKQDLGTCPKIHSEALKAEYEATKDKSKLGFEYDYLRDMQKYIDECNRRIEAAQRRLEKTPDEIRQTNNLLKQISDITKTINAGLEEVAVLASEGLVIRSLEEYFKIRQAKQSKEERERDLKSLSDTSGPSGHQKLQVCDVCGAYLSRLDNDRRLADHFYGKMHLGYAQMRKAAEALQKDLKTKGPPPPPPQSNYDRDGPGGGVSSSSGRADPDPGRRSGSIGRGPIGGSSSTAGGGGGGGGGYRGAGGYGRGGGSYRRGGGGRW